MAKLSTQRNCKRQADSRRRLWWAAAGGLILFVAWQVVSNPLPSSQGQSVAGLAPDITLTTRQGDYRLSERKGNLVALYFSFIG